MANEAIRKAEDHFYSRANISHVLARLRIAQGRHVEALSILRECWQTCLERGIVQMYPILAARMGEAYLALGDIKAATEILSKPERLDVPLGENAFGWGWLFVAQGRAFLAAGDHAQARMSGQRALALAEERGEPPQQAYALKLLGDTSLAKGDRSEAQSYLERALELATKCDMRPLMDQCSPALESRSHVARCMNQTRYCSRSCRGGDIAQCPNSRKKEIGSAADPDERLWTVDADVGRPALDRDAFSVGKMTDRIRSGVKTVETRVVDP